MNELVTCTVYGERAATFEAIFGTATIPIVSPLPQLGILPGIGKVAIYKLDVAALTSDQRAKLVAHLAQRFGLPAADVERDLDVDGMPILAQDCGVSIPPGLPLSMMDRPVEDDEWEDDYRDDDDPDDDIDWQLAHCGMMQSG